MDTLFLFYNYIKMSSIIKKLYKQPSSDGEFSTSDLLDTLDEESREKFKKRFEQVMWMLKQDFFLHPEMQFAMDLILPQDKKEADAIKHERYHTIAHNIAYLENI